jgi:hypothetical protein
MCDDGVGASTEPAGRVLNHIHLLEWQVWLEESVLFGCERVALHEG